MSGVPTYPLAAAEALAHRLFGIAATARPLPSDRDQNVMLETAAGRRFVLKIANAQESRAVLEAEIAVMQRLAATGLVPAAVPTVDGSHLGSDGDHLVRLITALPGRAFGATRLQTRELRRGVGRALGAVTAALQGFDHPACRRELVWDLTHAGRVVRERLELVRDPQLGRIVRDCLAEHERTVVPVLPTLRRSVIHGDANDYNVLVDGAAQRVTGIIDFGDMVWSPTVHDIAIAMAYAALDTEDPLAAAADVLAGFHAELPLTEPELSVLFSMLRMRLCVSMCMAAAQQAQRPDDAYLGISQGPITRTLPTLAAVHPRLAHYTFRHACGLVPVPQSRAVVAYLTRVAPTAAALLEVDLRTAPVAPLDFSAGSPLIASDPAENTPPLLDARIQRVLAAHGAQVGAGGYDEARLIYDWPEQAYATEPRTIHMGLDLSVAAGSPLFAPLDGVVHGFEYADAHHDYGPLIVLRHQTDDPVPVPFYVLYGHLSRDSLRGLAVGQAIARGTNFARVGSAPSNGNWWSHVHVQIATDMLDVPCNLDGAVRASHREVWKSVFPDPNLLLGIPARSLPASEPVAAIAASRAEHIGRNLSISYGTSPLNIVRGSGQYLYDHNGHRYLDAYNNVAHVGHCHPRVVRAVSEQLALLNTNTRYLQAQLTRYATALTALLPGSLSVCFFTASGSEANELALRLARAHTGQRDLIVMDAAYHGHTTTLIDISPYKHDGPGGQGAPDWVHTSPIPDVYRQRGIRGAAGPWFAAKVGAVIDRIRATGRGLCGYIAETCPSVGGQILLPEGFLADVYARVRAAGGVCIADEVQTGFGRLGTCFWGFEAQRVTPDIVVLGKPIANGYPMGAVITTKAIAASFDTGMEYFSTFGGSTAACAAAMATLQVTLDERLQQHALEVGDHLLAGLRRLMAEHPVVGDVRGSGLFLGVELVRDRDTLEPAAHEAAFVVNRMRQRGVLAGTDGPHHNVIKIRGPMQMTLADADRVVATMARGLSELPVR
jgi:4-aminobutyrate aminotransferase-like enzyme/Ser/Thr protein kinase RdoA (MazF antagonist)